MPSSTTTSPSPSVARILLELRSTPQPAAACIGQDCGICIQALTAWRSWNPAAAATSPDRAIRLNKCGHVFHAACLLEWTEMAPTCPMCRANWPWPAPSPSAGPSPAPCRPSYGYMVPFPTARDPWAFGHVVSKEVANRWYEEEEDAELRAVMDRWVWLGLETREFYLCQVALEIVEVPDLELAVEGSW